MAPSDSRTVLTSLPQTVDMASKSVREVLYSGDNAAKLLELHQNPVIDAPSTTELSSQPSNQIGTT